MMRDPVTCVSGIPGLTAFPGPAPLDHPYFFAIVIPAPDNTGGER